MVPGRPGGAWIFFCTSAEDNCHPNPRGVTRSLQRALSFAFPSCVSRSQGTGQAPDICCVVYFPAASPVGFRSWTLPLSETTLEQGEHTPSPLWCSLLGTSIPSGSWSIEVCLWRKARRNIFSQASLIFEKKKTLVFLQRHIWSTTHATFGAWMLRGFECGSHLCC